jgi:hypothetical protein
MMQPLLLVLQELLLLFLALTPNLLDLVGYQISLKAVDSRNLMNTLSRISVVVEGKSTLIL